MSDYTFSTLNDKDFEVLVKDLLNEEYKLGLQHFKSGKDQGIDLRYSSSKNSNEIVVQVKHFIGTGYSGLKSVLKNKELPKIKKLTPSRYLIATSLSLSAPQKDEITKILAPYVLSANDIFGNEDLNSILGKHPEILKKHFKLWFSSTVVLNTILNNAIESRTKYLLDDIKNNIKFYVVTEKLPEALQILSDEKLILITGQPGIGKTTLAELIIFEKASTNYQILQVETITEAETMISRDDKQLQLFYFDDFLGANYYEIVNSHKTETQLTRFVERVKTTPNKYIVLTTRTVILNQAVERYEKIRRSSLGQNQFELRLNDYDQYEKALILYNHMYFRKLNPELHEMIVKEKFYTKIISHRNYTPRIIEFITDPNQTRAITPGNYREFIQLNLNNPKEIWRSSFLFQIEHFDRCLLFTMFTFEHRVKEITLSTAFEERLNYEKVEHNQITHATQFEESIKTLQRGFLSSYLNTKGKLSREYQFINPSLADFLIAYIKESYSEKRAIVKSIKYIEQLQRFDKAKSVLSLETDLQIILHDRISNALIGSITAAEFSFSPSRMNVLIAKTLCRYCPDVDKDNILLLNLSAVQFSESWSWFIDDIIYILHNLGDAPQTTGYIKNNFYRFAEKIIIGTDSLDTISEIPSIFNLFDQIYEDYMESEEGMESLLELAHRILAKTEESIKDIYKDQVTNMDDVPAYYDDINSAESELNAILFSHSITDFGFEYEIDDDFWIKHIHDNFRSDEYFAERYHKHHPSSAELESFSNEEDMIDDLFE